MMARIGKADAGDPVGRVRIAGLLEGCSFLLLLGVAMPLKYRWDLPEAVRWTGWGHGLLFIIYLAAVFAAWAGGRLSFKWSALAVLAAFLPAGPFVIDAALARIQRGNGSA